MGSPGRARLGLATLFAFSCSGRAEPQVTIVAVTPSSAYSDVRINMVIQGGPFRPIYDIDTTSGKERAELGAFTAFLTPTSGVGPAAAAESLMWVSPSELDAILPKEILPGTYDVEVRDP